METSEKSIDDSICSSATTFRETLSKINILAQKCFLRTKIESIILTIWHRIRVSYPRKPLVKLCGKSACRRKSGFLVGKFAITDTNTNEIRNGNTQYQYPISVPTTISIPIPTNTIGIGIGIVTSLVGTTRYQKILVGTTRY